MRFDDVFICYKETDTNGERTEDSVLAEEIYNALTSKGYKVFFSKISLENKLGNDYEPIIFIINNVGYVFMLIYDRYGWYIIDRQVLASNNTGRR